MRGVRSVAWSLVRLESISCGPCSASISVLILLCEFMSSISKSLYSSVLGDDSVWVVRRNMSVRAEGPGDFQECKGGSTGGEAGSVTSCMASLGNISVSQLDIESLSEL